MTDADKRMNPLYFGIDPDSHPIWINPEIQIRFPDNLVKVTKVHLVLAEVYAVRALSGLLSNYNRFLWLCDDVRPVTKMLNVEQ